MWKLNGNKKRNSRPHRGRLLYVALLAVGFFLIANSSQNLVRNQRDDAEASAEYGELRTLFYTPAEAEPLASPQIQQPAQESQPAPPPPDGVPLNTQDPESAPSLTPLSATPSGEQSPSTTDSGAQIPGGQGSAAVISDSAAAVHSDQMTRLKKLNPDFIGWITVKGMGIDYPIVQGQDNSYYLNVTFTGVQNPTGAIFMDSRIPDKFDAPVTIIYGHNMKNGTMFAPLNRYTDPSYLAAYPNITIVTSDGETLNYRIFAARRLDITDSAYNFDILDAETAAEAFPDAPDGASRFLLLSTCTNGGNRDMRMLVFAALVD